MQVAPPVISVTLRDLRLINEFFSRKKRRAKTRTILIFCSVDLGWEGIVLLQVIIGDIDDFFIQSNQNISIELIVIGFSL